MRFLAGRGLAQHVLADRFLPEAPADLHRDGDDPGGGEEGHDGEAAHGLQGAQPAPLAVDDHQRRDGEEAEQRDDRSLDEERDALRDPEHPEGGAPGRPALTGADIEMRQRALRENGGGKQRGVRLGDARLEGEAEYAGKRNARDPARPVAEQAAPEGKGGADSDDAAQHRDQPVDPGRRVGAKAGNRPRRPSAASRCRRASCSG